MKIQRVLCDYYNASASPVEATCNYNVSRPIVKHPRDYRLTVETAEVSLTEMPLDMDSDYEVVIRRDGVDTIHRLPKIIKNAEQFVMELNKIFNVQGLPSYLLWFKLNHDSLLSIHFVDGKTPSDAWQGVKVYLNDPLYKILKEFSTLGFRQYVDPDRYYYELKFNVDLDDGKKQTIETMSELVKFKSVRFTTNLPVRPYMVYRQETDHLASMNILTTVKVNSANFDLVNQRNLLYIPTETREIELDSTEEISSFRIGIEIYYATGHSFIHKLASGEYFEIALTFKEYNSTNV